MAHTNDEIDELNSLKHAASERRSKRADSASDKRAASKKKAASNKKAAPTPPSGTEEEDGGQSPPPASESEELFDKLTGQVETIFGEIGEASRERPVLALVSAFAVGVLVGHIFSKRQG
jgi:hypothetical protein